MMARDKDKISWITVTTLGIYFVFFLYFTSHAEATVSENFCDSSTTYNIFKTACINCWQNRKTRCPRGSRKVTRGAGTRGCRYEVKVGKGVQRARGCTHNCREAITVTRCCDGYWGQDCQTCPKDSTGAVCGGRGTCSDGTTGNGTCSCGENLTGSLCERCTKPQFYGSTCQSVCACVHGTCDNGINGTGNCFCESGNGGRYCDQVLEACSSLNCHVNASCLNTTGTVRCTCNTGYTGDGTTCAEINPCETGTNTPCNENATCTHTGPNQSTCQCKAGFSGDGIWCQAIDPCQTDNGGCSANSTICVFDGPATSHCQCKYGYDNYVPSLGCQIVDVCGKYEKTTCDPDATCKTVADGSQITVICTCPPDALEFNRVCYYDILTELKKLNETSEYANRLNMGIKFFTVTYEELLFNPSSWTLFVPVDAAFTGITSDDITSDPSWKVKARAHVAAGSFNVNFTEGSAKTIFSLLGYDYPIGLLRPGQIPTSSVNSSDEGYFADLKFGGKFSGRVLADAKPAFNGMIYIIDTLLEPPNSYAFYSNATALDTMRTFDSLSNFTALVEKSFSFQSKLMLSPPYALFAPTNEALSLLSEDERNYITSYLGRSSLEELLSYHMVIKPLVPTPGPTSQPDLDLKMLSVVRKSVIRSTESISVNVSTIDGSVALGSENAKIMKSEIIARGARAKEIYIYQIDKLMIPESIKPLVKNRCEVTADKNVRGPCGNCGQTICPPGGKALSADVSELLTCVYKAEIQMGDGLIRVGPKVGCSRLCSISTKTAACCPGFYGEECRSCPGPTHVACNSHGICSDTESGTGLCSCNANFTGSSCDQCSDAGKYGPDCNQDCLCQHGTCRNLVNSRGECEPGTCEDGYGGENCDRVVTLCANGTLTCHQFSRCVVDDEGNSSCVCDPGYTGSGESCIEFNPCPTFGCSINAFCLHFGGGKVACECMPNFKGDGRTCAPVDPCESEDRGQCSENAHCVFSGPGKHHCTCKSGYRGDGRVCTEVDACQLNNGGCHQRAQCTKTGPGTRTCVCYSGYSGDGINCIGNLLQEIALRSDLSQLENWITRWPSIRFLLMNLEPKFTCFLPEDSAWTLLSNDDDEFWISERHLPYLLKNHIVPRKVLSSQLSALKGQTLPTLLSSVTIYINPLTVGISDMNLANNRSEEQSNLPTLGKDLHAKLLVSDLPVTKEGLIHIVDSVLLPPRDVVKDYPPLSTMITTMAADLQPYSTFLNNVNSTGVLTQIEDSDNTPYTLFMAPNTARNMQQVNFTTAQLIRYHVIQGKVIRAGDVSSGEHVDTLIEAGYKLTLVRRHGRILVNGQEVTGDGNRTATGIIYKLSEKYLTPVKTRCDGYTIEQVRSHCLPCYYPNNCPAGSSLIAKENCLFSHKTGGGAIKTSVGCQLRCSQKVNQKKCCPGFFGPGCEPCPGGVGNVCFGFGTCSDGIKGNGICTCSDSKYAGVACETCRAGKYGRTCDQQCQCAQGTCNEGVEGDGTCSCNKGYRGTLCDTAITDSNSCNKTCHAWANCVPELVGAGTRCVCSSGYSGDGKECKPINPCSNPVTADCHQNAICLNTAPGQYNCTCKHNYEGDGRQCSPINPCFKDYAPSCDSNADCFMISPNASSCVCRENYEGDGKSCQQTDLCKTSNGGCSENAQCKMNGPGVRECTCNDDYVGDGVTCKGSIFSHISGNPQFVWFTVMDSFASLAPHILAQGGPIMAFLPSQALMMALSQRLLTYEEPATQLYLNHIVGCANMRNLSGVTRLRTLAGDVLNITETQSGFKINGNINILDEPIEFWNGFLYQIDAPIIPTSIPRILNRTTQPTKIVKMLQPYLQNASDSSEPMYKNMKVLLDNGFQWVVTLLETSGDPDILQYPLHNPWTLFLPIEDAFLVQPAQRLRSFLDTNDPTFAREYIRYHMVREAFIDPTAFMSSHGMKAKVRTMQGSNLLLSCAESSDQYGDIVINGGMAKVIGFDVFFFTTRLNQRKKAAIYIIDKVLDPPSVGGRCDAIENVTSSKCTLCIERAMMCPGNSTLVEKKQCSLKVPHSAVSLPGCQITCASYNIRHDCCEYHYGEDCHACPGGSRSPCSGNGQCNDGNDGDGQCLCKDGFVGTACERCADGRYGRNCLHCTCTVHGSCNSGINGDGTCYCDSEWTGQNCDQKRSANDICDPPCHPDGYCVKSGTCFCKPGYRGDGVNLCEFMDMCSVNNGGCSLYASCSIARDQVVCKCLPNFVGDGYVCEGYDPCTTSTKNRCHAQASCLYVSANVSRCACNAGYEGDGITQCTRKQPRNCAENHGGCSGHAQCVDIPPASPSDYPSVNCTCNAGYIGDGNICRGTILEVMTESLPMKSFLRIVRRMPLVQRRKFGVTSLNFTVFVPDAKTVWRRRSTVVLRHYKQGQVLYMKDLRTLQGILVESGDVLPIRSTSDEVFIKGVKVTQPDIIATNGVIHLIDGFIPSKNIQDSTPQTSSSTSSTSASTASTTSKSSSSGSKSTPTPGKTNPTTPTVKTVKPAGKTTPTPKTSTAIIPTASTKSSTVIVASSSSTLASTTKGQVSANNRRNSNGIKIGVALGVIAIIMIVVGVVYWWRYRRSGGFRLFPERLVSPDTPEDEAGLTNPVYDSTGFNATDDDDVILHETDDDTALALRGDERPISFENAGTS